MGDEINYTPPTPPQPPRVQPYQGDAVSQLLQMICRDVGVTGVPWTGRGHDDARLMATSFYNFKLARDELWKSFVELGAMPELQSMPEAIQTKVCIMVLRAKACMELGSKR